MDGLSDHIQQQLVAIQQALYESMPAALRTALHAEAARELAAAGADVLSVAQQLSAANKPGERWARTWLVEPTKR